MLKYHIDQFNIFGDMNLLRIIHKISQKLNYAIFKHDKSKYVTLINVIF